MTKNNFAAGQLRSYIDRVLTLKIEQDELGVDIREVYKEAHSAGFDKNVIGQVVQRIRKEEKNGADRVQEADAVLELYLDAYRGGSYGEEGNRTTEPAEAIQRPPEPREMASKPHTRTRVRAKEQDEATDSTSPASRAEVEQAGEGTAVPPSPADHSYDPMTGEIDAGPIPDFLRKGKRAEAVQ